VGHKVEGQAVRRPYADNGRAGERAQLERAFAVTPASTADAAKAARDASPLGSETADRQTVLLADADPGMVRVVQSELQGQGFDVMVAGGGEEAFQLAEEGRASILVLGLSLPERSGIDVMTAVHEQRNVPVILVSAESEGGEKVRALDMGADDFLVKPFSPEELSARVRAVLRRTNAGKPGMVVRMDGVEVDLERHTVTRHGSHVRLTRTEWMLLEHLIANAGHVLMNRDLLEKVWGPEYTSDLQYLRVWISRLRRKLEANPSRPRFIKTYAGIGYMLEVEGVGGQ
jgi:two-component system KDP operon response regulator KdpE